MNIQEEIYKCSKCGLCKNVCPIFLASKNELFLPRGRFILLNRLNGNFSSLSKRFLKSLDLCLNCNLCKEFCPSSINSAFIFSEIKAQLNYKFLFIPFFVIFYFILVLFNCLKFFNYLFKFKNKFLSKLFSVTVKRANNTNNSNVSKGNVIYFEGCFNKYINPSDKNACINIINSLGYKIVKIDSHCCGYPFLSDGNIKKFQSNLKKIFSNYNFDFNYFICSCDTCFEVLNSYVQSDENYNFIKDKLIRFDDFLKINEVSLPECEAYYHKTLLRKDECYLPAAVKPINRKGVCSLFENFFMLKHPVFTKKYFNNLFYNPSELTDKTIITSCNISKAGLIFNSCKLNSNVNIISYSEYVMQKNKN